MTQETFHYLQNSRFKVCITPIDAHMYTRAHNSMDNTFHYSTTLSMIHLVSVGSLRVTPIILQRHLECNYLAYGTRFNLPVGSQHRKQSTRWRSTTDGTCT